MLGTWNFACRTKRSLGTASTTFWNDSGTASVSKYRFSQKSSSGGPQGNDLEVLIQKVGAYSLCMADGSNMSWKKITEVESFSRRKKYLWALEGLRWALAGTRKAKFEVLIREAWDLKLCMPHQKITRNGLNHFLEWFGNRISVKISIFPKIVFWRTSG